MAPTKDQIQRLLNPFAMFRGDFISAYAQVEYLLADIWVHARRRPEYIGLDSKFPYRIPRRSQAARKIFTIEGPLQKYAAEADPLLDRIRDFEHRRDMLAHGYLKVFETPEGGHQFLLRMYAPKPGHRLTLHSYKTNLQMMKDECSAISKHTHEFTALWHRIYSDQGFESDD